MCMVQEFVFKVSGLYLAFVRTYNPFYL